MGRAAAALPPNVAAHTNGPSPKAWISGAIMIYGRGVRASARRSGRSDGRQGSGGPAVSTPDFQFGGFREGNGREEQRLWR